MLPGILKKIGVVERANLMYWLARGGGALDLRGTKLLWSVTLNF